MMKEEYRGDPDALAAVERAMARADEEEMGAAPPMEEPPVEEMPEQMSAADQFAEADAALSSLSLEGADIVSRLAPLKAESPDVYGRVADLLISGGGSM